MRLKRVLSCCVSAFLACCLPQLSWSQKFGSFEREQAQGMLRDVASDVKKHYYDPTFHGVDWDAKVRETKDAIDKADSMSMAIADVAAVLDGLHDSHTFFQPPGRTYAYDYGFEMQMIGDRCYVIAELLVGVVQWLSTMNQSGIEKMRGVGVGMEKVE